MDNNAETSQCLISRGHITYKYMTGAEVAHRGKTSRVWLGGMLLTHVCRRDHGMRYGLGLK